MLPDGSAIQSSHEALLPFPQLLQAALKAHIFLDLQGQALLSMGTFCNAGCTAIFDATLVKITYKGNIVLEVTRVPLGLWKTQLLVTQTTAWQGEANGVFTTQIRTNTIKFLHAACFSSTTQTWTQAIAHGHFRSIPDLKVKAVQQLLPKSVATTLGHLDQQRQNWQSTKAPRRKKQPSDKEVKHFNKDTNPTKEQPTHEAMAKHYGTHGFRHR
jgi:hypothetical protein